MIPCSSSISTSFSTVGASQFPTVRLCFGPSCTTSLNLIYVAHALLAHLVVVATLQRANHQSVAQRVLQSARSSVRLLRSGFVGWVHLSVLTCLLHFSTLACLIRFSTLTCLLHLSTLTRLLHLLTLAHTLSHTLPITHHSLSHIARHVQANRLIRTILRRRVVRLVEAAEQRREIQLARMHPSCHLTPSPTAGCDTRTQSSRRARCSRRWPPARDIYVSSPLARPLLAHLQLPLHIRDDLVRLRFTPSPSATSRALFTPYRASWSRFIVPTAPLSIAYVTRLSHRHCAELRLRPEQRAVVVTLQRQRPQQVARGHVQLRGKGERTRTSRSSF